MEERKFNRLYNINNMKKYNIVYSIDLSVGVRFLELWANNIVQALSVAKDRLAAENDTNIKNIHIIKIIN